MPPPLNERLPSHHAGHGARTLSKAMEGDLGGLSPRGDDQTALGVFCSAIIRIISPAKAFACSSSSMRTSNSRVTR
jgi:hypothetical protein